MPHSSARLISVILGSDLHDSHHVATKTRITTENVKNLKGGGK